MIFLTLYKVEVIVNGIKLGIVGACLGRKMLWWAVGRLGRCEPVLFYTYDVRSEPLKNWIWSRAVL